MAVWATRAEQRQHRRGRSRRHAGSETVGFEWYFAGSIAASYGVYAIIDALFGTAICDWIWAGLPSLFWLLLGPFAFFALRELAPGLAALAVLAIPWLVGLIVFLIAIDERPKAKRKIKSTSRLPSVSEPSPTGAVRSPRRSVTDR